MRTAALAALTSLILIGAAGCSGPPAGSTQGKGPSAAQTKVGGLVLVRRGDLYLVTRAGGPARRLTKGLSASHPLFSPDGRYVAFLDGSAAAGAPQRVGIVGADGKGLHVFRTAQQARAGNVAWRPSGDVLALWGASLQFLRPDGTLRTPVRPRSGSVIGFAWAPAGGGYGYVVTPTVTAQNMSVRADALYVSAGGSPARRIYTADKMVGILLAGYWPGGKGLLFWLDPSHSASLAADGLPLESMPLGGGTPRTLATTLPYRQWVQPDGQDVLVVAGDGRIAWSGKALERCAPLTGTCTSLAAPPGDVAIDPAGSRAAGRVAYVTAKDLGTGVWSPSQGGLAAWQRTRTLYVRTGSGAAPQRVAAGGVFDPTWSADGSSLAYVRQGALWLWRPGKGSLRVATLAAPASLDYDYYGFTTYRAAFAWSGGE